MLPKKKRVAKKLFNHILKVGHVYNVPHLSLRIIKENVTTQRIACVVPKSTERKASQRNKLRRRGYYALSQLLRHENTAFSGIIFIKKGGKKLPYKEFKKEMDTLLKKAGVLKTN